jgi:hypothetical protein
MRRHGHRTAGLFVVGVRLVRLVNKDGEGVVERRLETDFKRGSFNTSSAALNQSFAIPYPQRALASKT